MSDQGGPGAFNPGRKENKMKVKDYLKRISWDDDVTFINARAREDAHTPYYHPEYQTTPIRPAREWYSNDKLMNSIVLNDRQMPIDWLSGAQWGNLVRRGDLKCLLIISQEDFALLYQGEEQRRSMEQYIDKMLDV